MEGLTLEQFADKMAEIIPLLTRGFLKQQSNELLKGRITFPQFIVLEFLHREGESRMTDVARFIGVSTAAMTGIVDRLVRDGYVVRVYEPNDRRIIKIKTTFKGANLVKKITRHRRLAIMSIFARILPKEREDYLRILMRIRDVTTEQGKHN